MSYFAPKSEATGLYHTAQLASPCNGTRGKPAERNPPVGKWVASREPDTASAFIGGVWELKRLKVVGREPIIPANTLEWLRRQGPGVAVKPVICSGLLLWGLARLGNMELEAGDGGCGLS